MGTLTDVAQSVGCHLWSEALWFDSQSGGHVPGRQVGPWSGCVWEAIDQCSSPSFSLPSPLRINKIFLKIIIKKRTGEKGLGKGLRKETNDWNTPTTCGYPGWITSRFFHPTLLMLIRTGTGSFTPHVVPFISCLAPTSRPTLWLWEFRSLHIRVWSAQTSGSLVVDSAPYQNPITTFI